MKFRKKPIVIKAVQLRWETWSEMCAHAGIGKLSEGKPEGCYVNENNQPVENGTGDGRIALAIPTLEGLMIGVENDWIIGGIKGELYPCKPDIFAATYEPEDAHVPIDAEELRELMDHIYHNSRAACEDDRLYEYAAAILEKYKVERR